MRSLRVAVAVATLCFAGGAFAEKKVERTKDLPKPGSGCSVAEDACKADAGKGCTTAKCKEDNLAKCTKSYNDCVAKNPAPK